MFTSNGTEWWVNALRGVGRVSKWRSLLNLGWRLASGQGSSRRPLAAVFSGLLRGEIAVADSFKDKTFSGRERALALWGNPLQCFHA